MTLHPAADKILAHETVRFVITGGGAAALFYLLTVLFLELGAAAFAGTMAAYGLTFVAAYTIQHAWTFRGRQAHRTSFPRYLLAQAMTALVASLIARLSSGWGAPPLIVAAASTLCSSALSFCLSRYWVFAPRPAPLPADL